MNLIQIILLFTLIVPFCIAEQSVVDYCVANLTLPKTPGGYPCIDENKLTSNDFVFTGFHSPGNTSESVFKSSVIRANDDTFPALNGLGLAMSRIDIAVGGVVPIHTHRVSEIIIVIEGTIIAGFIGTNHTAYYKTLYKYDVMIFPHSLLHFQVNVGDTPALAFVSLNSANPGFQTTSLALGANDLPTEIVSKITLLDEEEVRRLKAIFNGTNDLIL
ncbi:auxin-binding protein ABP19a-like [Amaranthus tricolor]|uniref:auxin-binding protein ABP19a-like n=1 Tax=Amaranthus tricolor TaxID=29722 RepID=UPI00258445D4|nr:auxin-binding protein ABP19a-like [Amaranthus tricolor]